MDEIAPEKTDPIVVAYEIAIVGACALFAYQVGKIAVGWTKEGIRTIKTKKNQTQD